MPAELLWSPQSRTDILQIYLRIAADNPSAADRFLARIERRATTLAEHPRLGPRRDQIRPGARMLIERPYLILYEIRPDDETAAVEKIEIVRVVDGRRDLRRLLR
jgi:toxin ParE1/3/4